MSVTAAPDWIRQKRDPGWLARLLDWKPLLVLLAHMRQAQFIREGLEVSYLVAEKPQDAVPMILDSARRSKADQTAAPLISNL